MPSNLVNSPTPAELRAKTPLKPLRLLSIVFDSIISPKDLPAFRGAISERVGWNYEWFHNHNNDPESSINFHYRYPKIQYKMKGNQPMILAIDAGIEEAGFFLSQWEWDVTMKGRSRHFEIDQANIKKHILRVENYEENGLPFRYQIKNWQALNQENYKRYQDLDGLRDTISFLEKILANNIMLFVKEMNWQLPDRFEVRIMDMFPCMTVDMKGARVLTFTLDFRTNIFLPSFIGLGKGVSLGFGTITRKRSRT